MLYKERKERSQGEIIYIDDLVPKNHLLGKIDEAVEFTKIYDIVGGLYSSNNGRPSTDPVVLFKAAIIQHIYGIPSLRRTAEEISLCGGKQRLSPTIFCFALTLRDFQRFELLLLHLCLEKAVNH